MDNSHTKNSEEKTKSGDCVGYDILSNWSILFNIGQPYSHVFHFLLNLF